VDLRHPHGAQRGPGASGGIVWINDAQPAPTEMPWGGFKQSGVGRELGKEGVDDFLESKSVCVNLAE
jgi:betaine-aldehyde dehydrogenase